MLKPLHYLIPLVGLALGAAACNDDDGPADPGAGEEEVITTVRVTFASADDTAELLFRDADVSGTGSAVITGDTLAANTEYEVSIAFLNESVDPVDDITAEVEEEAGEHQVFYLPSDGLALTVSPTDADAEGRPVGLAAAATTVVASSGSLRVVLRHEPDKDAAGVAAGDITNAGGETDVEVDFPVVIE